MSFFRFLKINSSLFISQLLDFDFPKNSYFEHFFLQFRNVPFYLPELCSEIHLKIRIMEVITIESQAYKELTAKIDTIANFVTAIESQPEENPEHIWVDNHQVCTFLQISTKTLQRLRTANEVSYSKIRGKVFYRLSEIQRLLSERVIRRSDEHLQDLIKSHRQRTEQSFAQKV